MSTHLALQHAKSLWRSTDGGELIVGRHSIRQAVAAAGGTPAYLYDRQIIDGIVQNLRRECPADFSILYSIKANPNPVVVATLGSLLDGFDVASGSELTLAIGTSAGTTCIQFSGPGKSMEDIRRAVAAGIIVNVESIHQVSMVASAAAELAVAPRVCLRVNPSFLPGGSGLRMTGKATQFGIASADIPIVVAACRAADIEPIGFHFYWGTQCLEGAVIAEIQRCSWKEAQSFAREFSLALDYVNLGGGFGIPYFANDTPLDLAPIGQSLRDIAAEFGPRRGKPGLAIELGRYVVGPAGIYVTSIVDVKTMGGELMAISDGGLHQHLAATGHLGQGIHRPFPCFLPERIHEPSTTLVNVAGCLCTPIDMLARRLELPSCQIGELFGILQSGAYGFSASPLGFLGHRSPNEQVL